MRCVCILWLRSTVLLMQSDLEFGSDVESFGTVLTARHRRLIRCRRWVRGGRVLAKQKGSERVIASF